MIETPSLPLSLPIYSSSLGKLMAFFGKNDLDGPKRGRRNSDFLDRCVLMFKAAHQLLPSCLKTRSSLNLVFK